MLPLKREQFGRYVAIAFLVIQPLMLQNPIDPIFPGAMGKIQLSELLFPLMAVWVVLAVWEGPNVRHYLRAFWFLPVVFFVLAILLAGMGTADKVSLAPTIKYLYLIGLLIFFSIYCGCSDDRHQLVKWLLYSSLIYLVVSLAFFVFAFVTGEANGFAHVRDDFPYIGRIVRLIGPMTPTAKTYATYMLFLSFFVFLARAYISNRMAMLLLVLLLISSLLTLSRVGVAGACAALVAMILLRTQSTRYIKILAIPAILLAVAIELVTIFHVEGVAVNLDCDVPYEVERQTQYMGWFESPTMCQTEGRLNITFSSYFLMKLVAFDAWKSAPILGVGLDNFGSYWAEATLGKLPEYFREYIFTKAQSTFLTLLAEGGLVGLVAWLLLMGAFLTKVWTSTGRASENRVMFVVWVSCLVFSAIDLDVHNFRFLYCFLPLFVAYACCDHSRKPGLTVE